MENGRVRDAGHGAQQLSALRRIAELNIGDIRLTANQNIIIANVPVELPRRDHAHRRRSGPACRRSPACGAIRWPASRCRPAGSALAESERYLPELIDALDQRLAVHGLSTDDIVIRMTGCPNGCARPYLAEIGLVGKGPGRYNLYLGAAFDGSRLSKLYAEDLDHAGIVAALDPLLAAYAARRQPGERFGEFTIRAGFVARTGNGRDFHANVGKAARRMNAITLAACRRPTRRAWRAGASAGVLRARRQARDGRGRLGGRGLEGRDCFGRGRAVDVYSAADPCEELAGACERHPRRRRNPRHLPWTGRRPISRARRSRSAPSTMT